MSQKTSHKKLSRKFYTRNLLTIARELPGKILVKNENEKLYMGKIVEVEAYDGAFDEAAHTFIGKTKRNSVMFGEGGFFYVYFTYGAHFCCNIVTGHEGSGTAILIRAVEPVQGMEFMSFNRFDKPYSELNEKQKYNLTSGPGKVCQAFGINLSHYGVDLTGDKIYLLDQPKIKPEDIITTTRIGIKKSVELPWRFYIKGNPYVSKKIISVK